MLKNEIMAHCRLCLVKDDVNIAIFDNLQEICQKISSCLPVKVSKDDKLPKKICDGCNLKLEQFYEFVTASVQAERQLLEWLKDEASASSKADVRVKEELFEQQNAFEETVQAEYVDFKTKHTEDSAKEPPRKRARKAAVKVKPTLSQETDEEDDDLDTVAKVEDESADNSEQEESYEEVPGTSADDQPGPSGLSKGESEAPLQIEIVVEDDSEDFNALKSARKNRRMVKIVFTCRFCYAEFHSRRELNAHTRDAHSDVICVFPHKQLYTFKYDEDLNVYFCNSCTSEFTSLDDIQAHIVKVHEEQFTCEVCKEVLRSAYAYALHVRAHTSHPELFCPFCTYATKQRNCMRTHINSKHYRKFNFYCNTCGKGFNDPAFFKEHNNQHLGIKAFKCVVCGKEFMFSRYLTLHQVRAHTVHIEGAIQPNQCPLCLAVFGKMDTLKKHIERKHNSVERKHLCDICGSIFRSSDKLKIHYRIHTGVKPYQCKYCEKRFSKSDYLKTHERVHTGEKPFVCEYCGKCFNQPSSWRIHVRGHTGERPYICQLCHRGHISRGALNIHLKTCNGSVSE